MSLSLLHPFRPNMNTNLTVTMSNRLEELVDRLAGSLARPIKNPLSPEIVVVQSRGMERWVSMALAGRSGICSNVKFPFPNALIEDLLKALMPDLPEGPAVIDRPTLTFKIMKILPALIDEPDFHPLRSYVQATGRPLNLYQLCERIADTFDQYAVFRPEMIFSWEAGGGAHWQARLWRKLLDDNGLVHHARLQRTMIEKILHLSAHISRAGSNRFEDRQTRLKIDRLPERISLFGISYLPPFHLQVFAAISRLIPVHFFILNPCREFWGDILSEREMQRIRAGSLAAGGSDASFHLDGGNRLLASMGYLGKDFLQRIGDFESDSREIFIDPGEHTMLSCIQSDILNLRGLGAAGSDSAGKEEFPLWDGSVQIHSCHSPMREIEVLRDNLLALFEADGSLLPMDIVVMTPDIDAYAPYIQAVFDVQTDDASVRIPFSIADRSGRRNSRIFHGFLFLLELRNSRFTVSDVLSLLEFEQIREKFDLSEQDRQIVEGWIRETRVCWGIDARAKMRHGLPGSTENTWESAVDRLLLGYAMAGGNDKLFSGILPYDDIEGSDARVFGKFLDFLDALIDTADLLNAPKNLTEWCLTLNRTVDRFFASVEETAGEIHALRCILADLQRVGELSGFDRPLEADIVCSYISRRLDQPAAGSGFMTGGVTFCALLPMRSIPFKVVCLVGMNNDAFPRESRQPAFNLIERYPKPGDRSRRNDDKYLFLEAILSARNSLAISYIGQDTYDNTSIPPSVLVSELADYIQERFGIGPDQLITQHRLQAFSPEYFQKDGALFSYDKENFEAATRLFEERQPPPFIKERLSPPIETAAEWSTLDLDMFCAFFSNPARFLLQRRLGIYLEQKDRVLPEREPFNLDPLERFMIGQNLLKKRLQERNLPDFFPVQRAAGRLPHGNVGGVLYQKMCLEIETLVDRTVDLSVGDILPDIDVDISDRNIPLTGRITDIFKQGRLAVRYGRKRPQDLLKAWLVHLAMCGSGLFLPTFFVCNEGGWRFGVVQGATAVLKDLFSLYRTGICEPLHFFPVSSYEFARSVTGRSKTAVEALPSAKAKWKNEFSRGESEDPYYRLCFRQKDPLDDSFQDLALKVFSPLFAACEKIK